MKKLKYFITFLLVGFFVASFAFGASVLYPPGGGTGIGVVSAGDVGNCLKVLDDSPFTYELGSCGGGVGSPGGSTTQVQFNDAGVFGGNAGLTFAKTTGILNVGGFIFDPVSNPAKINNNTGNSLVIQHGGSTKITVAAGVTITPVSGTDLTTTLAGNGKALFQSQSLTGSQSDSLLDMSTTWNTTGAPTGLKFNVTNTASDAASLLADLQVGGTSQFKVSKGGALTVTGAVNTDTLTLTGTGTINGLDAIDATGETTLEATLDIAGDISSTGLSTTVIGNDKILESMLKAVDSAVDEECLTYEGTVGDFEWQSCGAGGATAWDSIGDPSGDGSVAFAGTKQDITSTLDAASGYILQVTDFYADDSNDTIFFSLKHNDGADPNVIYERFIGDADGTPTTDFNLAQTATGVTMSLGSAGVVLTDDGDGALTILGAGNGSDEDLILNLDDTSNTWVFTSSTGVGAATFGAIDLTGDELIANTSFLPDTNDGAALGTTALQFSDLFLAEGGVLNWDNGDATLTQVGNVVTLAGADLTTPNLTDSALTSGRVTLAGASGLLSDDSDFTFATDTLTITKIAATTLTGTATLAENSSIALDPAGSADGKYTGTTVTATAGYTQAFGDIVYLDPTDSRWEKTDSNSAQGADGDARGIIGIVVSAGTDGNPCTILLQGIIRADAAFPTFTVNNPIYISETAGLATGTQPTTTDVVIRILGFGITGDEMYFNPSNDYITHI